MAHFAELDTNNIVIRVCVGDNADVTANGGEQSTEAATHFGTIVEHSDDGVKWVQTSYNNNFRNLYAGAGYTYQETEDRFIPPQPYLSWTLQTRDDGKIDWAAPVAYPDDGQEYVWNEDSTSWVLKT